ncbi:MAG: hypothetical protein M1825_006436 [Sarcosagium campestre]|nr:MAG: hypothetical protein M1825_006436 [Sarcosagium campestre]
MALSSAEHVESPLQRLECLGSANVQRDFSHARAESIRCLDADLDQTSADAIFSHAILLFHSLSWHEAIKVHRTLLRREVGPFIPLSNLWFNIATLYCHLGEYAQAVEKYDRAIATEPKLALAWYGMGMSLFQLKDFKRAERRYKMCLGCLEPAQSKVDYRPDGLDYVLERERIEFNVRLCGEWKRYEQRHAERPKAWSLNRLPAGLIFESPSHRLANQRRDSELPNGTAPLSGDACMLKRSNSDPVGRPSLSRRIFRKKPTLLPTSLQLGRLRTISEESPAVGPVSPSIQMHPASEAPRQTPSAQKETTRHILPTRAPVEDIQPPQRAVSPQRRPQDPENSPRLAPTAYIPHSSAADPNIFRTFFRTVMRDDTPEPVIHDSDRFNHRPPSPASTRTPSYVADRRASTLYRLTGAVAPVFMPPTLPTTLAELRRNWDRPQPRIHHRTDSAVERTRYPTIPYLAESRPPPAGPTTEQSRDRDTMDSLAIFGLGITMDGGGASADHNRHGQRERR